MKRNETRLLLFSADVPEDVEKAGFTESLHPRAEDGKFTLNFSTAKYKTGLKLTATKTKAFNGKPVNVKPDFRLNKSDGGKLGEQIVIGHLHEMKKLDARPAVLKENNFAVDVLHNHTAIEVKAGQVWNSKGAQQWRVTVDGKKTEADKLWLKKHRKPADLKLFNQAKIAAAMKRKAAAVKRVEKETGKKIKAVTFAVLLNNQTRTADVYQFDGFHERIGWTAAGGNYVASYKY